MITVKNITKYYPGVKALDSFSCCFDCGITAVLGPNGAGKSTLMSILSAETAPSSGEVLWNGRNIIDVKKEYLSVLSYMPQMQNLIAEFTGYDFLYYIGYLKEIPEKQILKVILKYKDMLELGECLDRLIRTYSGGMRQRVLFLSCLLSSPKILLLDEPTAGMDPMQRNIFKNIIAEISADSAVILSTHIVQDVENIADHILIMNHGKVICDIHKNQIPAAFKKHLYCGYIQRESVEQFSKKYHITMLRNIGKKYYVKFISDHVIEGLKECRVTLEDYYLSETE